MARLSTECSHPTLMKDMCADCGADLRQDESNTVASSSSTASVAMVHSIPELKVSSAVSFFSRPTVLTMVLALNRKSKIHKFLSGKEI